jgi:acyl-coenzyme A thioesterase PaaI-like protein
MKTGALLVESSIHYMKGAREGETVYAEARLTYLGKRLGRVDTNLTNEVGELIAICHQIFYVKDRAYDEGREKTAAFKDI